MTQQIRSGGRHLGRAGPSPCPDLPGTRKLVVENSPLARDRCNRTAHRRVLINRGMSECPDPTSLTGLVALAAVRTLKPAALIQERGSVANPVISTGAQSAKANPSGWIGRRRGLLIAAAVYGAALALSLRWLTVSSFPLLFLSAPFAVGLFIWMKRMKRAGRSAAGSTSDAQSGLVEAAPGAERKPPRKSRAWEDDHIVHGIMLERYRGKF